MKILLTGVSLSFLVLSPPSMASETLKIAGLPAMVGIPFYTSMKCGADKAAKEFNVDLTWSGPADWDISKQQPFIDAAVQLKPQGYILSPTDSGALVSQVQALEAAGTPVVTVDGPLDKPVETQNVQADHYKGGVAAAAAMHTVAGDTGTFVAIGMRPGMPDIDGRVNGFLDTYRKEHPKAVLLPTLYPDYSNAKAAEQVSALLQSTPDLKGIYASHSAAAEGAAAALLEAGMRGKVKIIAFDAEPAQVKDLKDGVYDALIVQKPFEIGYEAVKTAASVIRGEVKKSEVKHDNFLPLVFATRENMSDPQISKYFYKSTCD